jgi:hypothetical protein
LLFFTPEIPVSQPAFQNAKDYIITTIFAAVYGREKWFPALRVLQRKLQENI